MRATGTTSRTTAGAARLHDFPCRRLRPAHSGFATNMTPDACRASPMPIPPARRSGHSMHRILRAMRSTCRSAAPCVSSAVSRRSVANWSIDKPESASGTTIQNLDYEWDADGNLRQRRDLNQGLAEEFRYDALDRLAQSRRNGAITLELDYDAIGNIRRKSDVCAGTASCYTYHATRKHAVVTAGSQTYGYDANGNMTSRGGAAIAWTSDNLPASIAHTNGNSSQFFLWAGRQPLEAGCKARNGDRNDCLCRRPVRESDARRRDNLAALRAITGWRRPAPALQRWHARSDALPHAGSPRQHRQDCGHDGQGARRRKLWGPWQSPRRRVDRTTGCGRARQDCDIHARWLHRSRATRQSRPHSHERSSLRPQARALHQRGSLRHASLRQPGAQSLHVFIEQPARIHRSERIRPSSLRGDSVW